MSTILEALPSHWATLFPKNHARLWHFNIDAEDEAQDPKRLQNSEKRFALVDRIAEGAHLALSPEDPRIDATGRLIAPLQQEEQPWSAPDPLPPVHLWCSSEACSKRLSKQGFSLVPQPSTSTMDQVLSREFTHLLWNQAGILSSSESSDLQITASQIYRSGSALENALARVAGSNWILKANYSCAGRGKKKIFGTAEATTLRWLHKQCELGGLLLEPLRAITREFSLHAFLYQDGRLLVGSSVEQQVNSQGLWLKSQLGNLEPSIDERLHQMIFDCAKALHKIDYFGPFGIDAYEYQSEGKLLLNPLNCAFC